MADEWGIPALRENSLHGDATTREEGTEKDTHADPVKRALAHQQASNDAHSLGDTVLQFDKLVQETVQRSKDEVIAIYVSFMKALKTTLSNIRVEDPIQGMFIDE